MNPDTAHKKEVVAIWYIDALYFYKKPSKWPEFAHYMAVGNLVRATNECVVLEYTEKNHATERGLLVPAAALVLPKEKQKISDILGTIKQGMHVGITWRDVVYFDEGVVPEQASVMYSEGEVVMVKEDAVIIHNTKTVKVSDTTDFPNTPTKPAYFMIPAAFITRSDVYEK
jgi:hypothetical protein